MPTKLLTAFNELLWNLSDTLNPLIAQMHTRFAKNVTQELNMIHTEVALGWFESDVEFH